MVPSCVIAKQLLDLGVAHMVLRHGNLSGQMIQDPPHSPNLSTHFKFYAA
jgi:hypothetical protein